MQSQNLLTIVWWRRFFFVPFCFVQKRFCGEHFWGKYFLWEVVCILLGLFFAKTMRGFLECNCLFVTALFCRGLPCFSQKTVLVRFLLSEISLIFLVESFCERVVCRYFFCIF